MSLHTLPTEILRKIFLFFHDLDESLASVVRTCWRLHDIAEPILYQVVRGGDPSSLEGLMRAFIRRPELVENIKFFNSPTAPAETFQSVDTSYVTSEQWKRLRNTLQDDIYGEKTCDGWIRNLDAHFNPVNNYSVIVGFLLNLVAPHLEHLVLQTGRYSPYVQEVVEQASKVEEASTAAHLFPKLRSVHLGRLEHVKDFIPAEFVLPYLKMESVASLSIDGLQDATEPYHRPGEDPLSGPSSYIKPIMWRADMFQVYSIVDLTLTGFHLGSAAIREFLGRFYALERFSLRDSSSSSYFPGYLYLVDILSGLAQSRHCLKFLRLTGLRSYDSSEWLGFAIREDSAVVSAVVEMKELQNMSTLVVDRHVLLGKDHPGLFEQEPRKSKRRYRTGKCEAVIATLPETLKCLEVINCKTSILQFLQVLFAEIERGSMHNLERIKLTFNGEEREKVLRTLWNEGDWEQRALQKGITLTGGHLTART